MQSLAKAEYQILPNETPVLQVKNLNVYAKKIADTKRH